MINSTVSLFVLIAIVIFYLLFLWLIKTFVSMSKRKKEIYEKKLRNKCPFDHEHCGIIGKSMTDQYVIKICEKCSRYKNFKN